MTRKPKRRALRPDLLDRRGFEIRIEALAKELRQSQDANMRLARVNAKRADQFRALLQVANLLLAIANNEIIELEKLNRE